MAARSSPLIQPTRSPAVRPAGLMQIDPSRTGEYPVVLGEKLSRDESGDQSSSSTEFYGIRYNYKPKHIESSANQKTTLTRGRSDKLFNISIDDRPDGRDPISFKYHGSVDPKSSATASEPTTLALVFDQERQVFVVEPISAELNFNLVSGPGQLRQHQQLPVLDDSDDEKTHGQDVFGEAGDAASDDEPADSDNPYDYRHFMDHARATVKTTPASRAGASPNIQPQSGVSRLLTTSKPSASQSPVLSSISKAKPKTANSTSRASTGKSTARSGAGTSKAKSGAAAKPTIKSAAIITASDEESDEDEIILPASAVQHQNLEPPASKSQGFSSPHIKIDEASGLEIDMGSPPPAARRRGRINPSAFASRSPSNSQSASQSPAGLSGNISDDASDIEMPDFPDNGDSDIEALTLPPPKADTRRQSATGASNRISVAENPSHANEVADEDEEDDAGLEAFMDELQSQQDEDESEISEEE